MIEEFLKIGFKFSKSENTGAGFVKEYSYYPEYLKDNHYTLVTFRNHSPAKTLDGDSVDQGTDYRLYVHRNSDGSFVSSPFQLSDKGIYLEQNFKNIFKNELINLNRKKQLNKILTYENN
jgi:hypothetical protein